MRLRTDWLARVLTVPYLPILGPIHPDQLTAEMFTDVFADILTATRAGTALPFDKDRRWSPHKTDTVLVAEIVHRPNHTTIPTLSRRRGGTVTTFCYGPNPDIDTLRCATRQHRDAYRAAHGRVAWFSTAEPSHRAATRLLLKEFAPSDDADGACGDSVVRMLDDCPPDIASTFDTFTQAMADHGFAFLNQRRQAGQVDGPILIAQHNGAIVGAIGPLTILPDRFGARMLLPQYFGVLPNHRGAGHGRALWRAAQRWATRHHADYQLLQTTVGGASDRLFLTEGLRTLGFVATAAA